MSWLAAHQGGWDEALWFLLPAVGALVVIRWAERRARRRGGPPGDDGPDMT